MKKIDVEVNGLTVSMDESVKNSVDEMPVYMLLRKGDKCLVDDGGVTRRGVVRNIIRLSNGNTKFLVDLNDCYLKDWDMYDGWQVSPPDALQCKLRLTAFDMVLHQYEPKGQSLNVNLWGSDR